MATRPVTVNWTDNSTERTIMAAALRLFSSKGFHAVGIRDIAREAGISTAALYHYMKTKEELLQALMTDRLHRIMRAAEIACADLERPEEQLVALVRVHVIAHARFPSHIVDDEVRSLGSRSRRVVIKLRDRYERMWNEILVQGVETEAFAVDNVRFARLAMLEMCNGVNRWFSPEGPAPAERVAETFGDLALALVRATRDGRPLHADQLSLPPVEQSLAIIETVYQGVEEP